MIIDRARPTERRYVKVERCREAQIGLNELVCANFGFLEKSTSKVDFNKKYPYIYIYVSHGEYISACFCTLFCCSKSGGSQLDCVCARGASLTRYNLSLYVRFVLARAKGSVIVLLSCPEDF